MAVCDALDAMTSARAYRPAHSWEHAIGEIREKSGSWYDPDMVAAMAACLDDLRSIGERPSVEASEAPANP